LKVTQTSEWSLAASTASQATVLLVDRRSGTELWSKTKGGVMTMSGRSIASVAQALAKEFIKFYESGSKVQGREAEADPPAPRPSKNN
jgi:hypothetical protein